MRTPAPPEGQLWQCERELLADAVIRRRPKLVLEVGTWKGGGSTFQIVSSLMRLGSGGLVTCEPDPAFYAEASAFYSRHPYDDYCVVMNCRSDEAIGRILAGAGKPDLFFFDGPEDPQVALDDFMRLDAVSAPGTVFMMHDWLTPDSHKADLLRPYFQSLVEAGKWRVTCLLEPPHSVGLIEGVKT